MHSCLSCRAAVAQVDGQTACARTHVGDTISLWHAIADKLVHTGTHMCAWGPLNGVTANLLHTSRSHNKPNRFTHPAQMIPGWQCKNVQPALAAGTPLQSQTYRNT